MPYQLLPTSYRRIQPYEPLWVVIDPGNTDVKGMIHGHFGEEVVFPHSVRRPTKTDYANLALKYQHRSAQLEGSAIFESKGQGYVVGHHAMQVGRGERLLGAEKYTPEQLGSLTKALLLQVYPQGHEDVHLVVLHPADVNVENMRALYKSVKGSHVLKVADGREVKYVVTEVIPIEEPVGGFQSFLFNTEGRTYKNPRIELKPGMQFLVCDVGGRLTSFVPVTITPRGNVDINIGAAPVIERGIQDVMELLEDELKSAFPLLSKVQELPEHLMQTALMTDKVMIKNKEHECGTQVDNAMQVLASRIHAEYTGRYASGVGYNGIIVTGGGGGAAFNYLDENVFDHEFCFTAEDDLDRMRFSNIRGASKGLISFLAKAVR